MADFIIANTNEEYGEAAKLFKEYAAWLNIDLSFQKFEEELTVLKTMYVAPNGGVILCKKENQFVACVALRKIDAETAELKRMFVKPAFQQHGIGKVLLQKAVELAEKLSYTRIRLDTLSHMASAIKLYKQNGFYEIPAYYNNPNESAVYFELQVKPTCF